MKIRGGKESICYTKTKKRKNVISMSCGTNDRFIVNDIDTMGTMTDETMVLAQREKERKKRKKERKRHKSFST